MEEWFSLVDIVKVCFGALLGGVTVYFYMRSKQKRETIKEKAILELTKENATYFNKVQQLWGIFGIEEINGKYLYDISEAGQNSFKQDNKAYNSRQSNLFSIYSHLYLLDMKEAIKYLNTYDSEILDIRNNIANGQQKFPTSKELDTLLKKANEAQIKYLKEISNFIKR